MKIFRVSETEWYKHNSLEEAIALAMQDTGLSREELTEGITPAEVSETELDALFVALDPPGPRSRGARTFRKQLESETERGLTAPGVFASTEF